MIDQATDNFDTALPTRWSWAWKVLGGVVLVAVIAVASFELVYAGKVYPGVTANGVKLSSLSKPDAASAVTQGTTSYTTAVLPISYGQTTLHVPLNTLKINYDSAKAANLAYSYGRTGSVWRQAHEQLRALLGRATNFAVYTYDDSQLTPFLTQVSDDVSTPAVDASLTFADNKSQVTPAVDGKRLDLGQLILVIQDHLAATSTDTIAAPVYGLPAAVSTTALTAASPQADTDLMAPIELKYADKSQTVDQATIARWLKVSAALSGNFETTHDVRDLYPQPASASLAMDQTAITAYVAGLAGNVNQAAVNAVLAMQDGQLTVTKPSQNGIELDQASAVKSISGSLSKSANNRTITVPAKTTQAAVREDNLASLGITEQISEGETYFPGSPSTRLINVRAGAKRFNGVLLAPGEQFSFGKLLGQVDASTGYVPELVILGDHEEKQYGGGLCQVSSTAFRAALAAGLPINERINHAFAISYYTWPYAAPGVDATIYYPAVDFKFTNDTGHYILMQTTMSGVDLKFDFFGTKTKSGTLRGPTFVTGDSDPTKPSHTVFYRDVLDLAGKVVKTDTFNTYYKSSLDYPVLKTFN